MNQIRLKEVPGSFSVYRFDIESEIPTEIYHSKFFSVTKTNEELSVVCSENLGIKSKDASHNWRCLKIIGPLDFSMVGIIQHITTLLKDVQVSVFVISTYDTDYFLVQGHQYQTAIKALKENESIII